MSVFNLLDTKLADRQALSLLGVNLEVMGVFPVKTMSEISVSLQLSLGKSKPPFTVRVGSMNYVFFSLYF